MLEFGGSGTRQVPRAPVVILVSQLLSSFAASQLLSRRCPASPMTQSPRCSARVLVTSCIPQGSAMFRRHSRRPSKFTKLVLHMQQTQHLASMSSSDTSNMNYGSSEGNCSAAVWVRLDSHGLWARQERR